MNFTKMTKTISLLALISTLIVGCVTTTKTKNPVFAVSTDSLNVSLTNVLLLHHVDSCKNINLDGEEKTTNGYASSEMNIKITNGKNIPTDEKQMTELEKQIALVVRNSLSNKNEYGTYNIYIVTKKDDGGISLKTYKEQTFDLKDL